MTIFPEFINKLFRIPYYYRAEVKHSTLIITDSRNFDIAKYKATSVSFKVPENTATVLFDTVDIMLIPLAPGDPLREFKSEIPHRDTTVYDIKFKGIAGTQSVLYAYITQVISYTAVRPDSVVPCVDPPKTK
jgi:hypothetical protein